MPYEEVTDDMQPERYEPSWTDLEATRSEGPFMEASFYLLKEATIWMSLLAASRPIKPSDRNEAILRGLAVRLTKLMRLTLRELMAKETFQQLNLSRDVIETVANIVYLMNDPGDNSRYDQYVMNSLVAEREVLQDIAANVGSRDNTALQIEQRMMRSIANTAKAAGIDDVSTLPGRRQIGWPKAEDRVKLLGPNAYVAYRMGSAQTHGDWTDLYRNHLEFKDGIFTPNMDPFEVRPQVPLMMARLFTTFIGANLKFFFDHEPTMTWLDSLFQDLDERIIKVDDLHEKLLDEHSTAP